MQLKGGETRLHSHEHLDGMWMVLAGRARFYGDGDTLLGELEPFEGIMVPRNFKYWFECASEDEPLVLLQVEASDIPLQKFFSGAAKNIVEDRSGLVRRHNAVAAGGSTHRHLRRQEKDQEESPQGTVHAGGSLEVARPVIAPSPRSSP